MYRVKEAIIVEGTYDKIKLSGFIDGVIMTTHGFAVYNNDDFIKTMQHLADETGIVILTDSDTAGLRIRNYLKQKIKSDEIKHAYVPDILGVEKRKNKASAEGLLGVEGMSEEIIIKALYDAGCTIDNEIGMKKKEGYLTKADMYEMGLSGKPDSKRLRELLSHELGVPAKLSSNMLLDVLNRLTTREEIEDILSRAKK